MKFEEELNKAILRTTLLIQNNYPELIKYLNEMPITIAKEKDAKVDIKNLQDYLESLELLIDNYKVNHIRNLKKD
jgi:hypothetical protein